MVLLKVKVSEEDQFLHRATIEASVNAVRTEIVQLHNFRQKIRRLKIDGEELAKYGPMKECSSQGIDSYCESPAPKGEFYEMDPTGKRTGNACNPTAAAALLKVLTEAHRYLHKSLVEAKRVIFLSELQEAVDQIRGAVLMCYPMGLPRWDPVRLLLENQEEEIESYGHDGYKLEESVLWFAGKELRLGTGLKQYLGRSENTTAVIKLLKKDHGAPAREPVIDEETYKGMLSWAHKKQEQQKALEENQDDVYLESEWANTKSLKKHLSGLSHIRI